MANDEHLNILDQGKDVWRQWRGQNREIKPDFSGADFRRADFMDMDLRGANLSGAILAGANLSGANLLGANLRGADLRGANLIITQLMKADLNDADLSNATLVAANLRGATLALADLSLADLSLAELMGANLSGANLNGTRLDGANFNSADLNSANLSNAIISSTIFGGNDLSVVKGLELVKHEGPSTIGVDTLYISGGQIPKVFLRDCGLPDDLISFIPSLFGVHQAIEFYSCFISYSTKDEDFARRLYSRMRDEQLRVWFAPEDVKGGEKLYEQIERAIQLHDRLLVILSEHSMQSEWVITELRKARKQENQQKRRKLFPIRMVNFETIRMWECFDADSGKDLAVEIREYFIPDFSNWKDQDSFEASFNRLLKDLRAAEPH